LRETNHGNLIEQGTIIKGFTVLIVGGNGMAHSSSILCWLYVFILFLQGGALVLAVCILLQG
jgi:hypothetical protein